MNMESSIKNIMIDYISTSLSLTQKEITYIKSQGFELPDQCTLSQLITHLESVQAQTGLISKLSLFYEKQKKA